MAFPRFVIVGILNTGISYLFYLGFLLLMPYIWAYTLTYAFGIFLGYLLNTLWVFKVPPRLYTLATYPLTYGLNYIFGVSILWFFVEILNLPKEIAPLIVVAISVPVMYLITKALFHGKISHEKKSFD